MFQTNSVHQIVSGLFDSPLGLLFVWALQTFIVLGVAWAAIKFDRSRTAATRCRIWLIAMVVCALLPPLTLFSRSLPGPAAPIIPALPNIAGQFIPPSAPIAPAHISWMVIGSLILAALWAVGVFVSLLRLAASLWRLRRIKAAAEPVSASALDCVGVDPGDDDATAKQLERIPIALSREVRSPGLAGIFRPAILLPADITSWTTAEERSAMLRHEAAHIERWDHIAGLFVSTVRAFLFFHPMVHLACNRISLERELACDDRVLGLGAKPQAYAESILKAVERSILVDAVHQAPSFASKKTLERRIEMILKGNHGARPLRQWRFLLLPAALIIAVTWLVMPPGNGLAQAAADGAGNGSGGKSFYATLALPFVKSFSRLRNHTYRALSPRAQKDVPVVDKNTIWVDKVQRGPMVRRIRGLGAITSAGSPRSQVQVELPESMTKEVQVGQPAIVADHAGGKAGGNVISISQARDGIVKILVQLEPNQAERMRPPAGLTLTNSGSPLDVVIQVGQLDNVLFIGRPLGGKEDSTGSLFKLDPDGKGATRVQVEFGKSSVNTIQILDGLSEGDRAILSDTSNLDNVGRIILK